MAAANGPIGLGTASSYAVLAGSTVTNTGPSVIEGDVGLSPGTAITGFPPGTTTGVFHAADAEALQAKTDLIAAFDEAAGRSPAATVAAELGGLTLLPGVYVGDTLQVTGALTLDVGGDPDAVFVLQSNATLVTASNSSIALINGASPCNVYWLVHSSATIGTAAAFTGTVMALTSISATTGATIEGRLLARNGAVTLDANVIDSGECAAIPPATTTTSTSSTTSTTAAAPTSPSNQVATTVAPDEATPAVPATPVPTVPAMTSTSTPGTGTTGGPPSQVVPPSTPGQVPPGPRPPLPGTPPPHGPRPPLARTGSDTDMAIVGAILVAVGAAFVAVSRLRSIAAPSR